MEAKNLWDLLEEAPQELEPVANCLSWAMNEGTERGNCWMALLDLIGYSSEYFGEKINHPDYVPGFLEADYLAKALTIYAARPYETEQLINALVEADQ